MIKLNPWLIFTISTILLSGCSMISQDNSEVESIFPEKINRDWLTLTPDASIHYPKDMYISDTCIYILSLLDGYWLHAYNISNLEAYGNFILDDKNSESVINAKSMSIDDNGINIFDIGSSSIKCYSNDFNHIYTYQCPKGSCLANRISNTQYIISTPVVKNGH